MRNGKPVPKDGSPARIQRRTRLSRIVSISDGHPLRGFPDRGFQNGDGNRENQLRPRPSLHVQKIKTGYCLLIRSNSPYFPWVQWPKIIIWFLLHVNMKDESDVIPQLRSDILCQDRGGLSRENLKRHIWAVSQGVDTLKMVPIVLPAGCPPSKDPLFKVSEGRPPRSNRTRDGGVTVRYGFPNMIFLLEGLQIKSHLWH